MKKTSCIKKSCIYRHFTKYVTKRSRAKVVNIGGIVGDTVTSDTNFLVMGIQDYTKFVDGKESNKIKKQRSSLERVSLFRL